jgi:uncharacterized membrane protein
MNKYIKVSLLVLIIIGFLIISMVVVNFFINGHIHWFSEVDKDYFGIFGDFIGGVTGTIFTIVANILVWLTYNSQREELEATRNLLIKQLELSYKPDLFIKDTKIYIYGVVRNSILCPKYITNAQEYSKEIHSYAFVELINVGGEISKRTNCSWDCDLKEIEQFFDDNFSNTDFKISFPNQNRSIEYKSLNGTSTLGPLNMLSLKQTTDFVLPYKIISVHLKSLTIL